ncbi:TatD family hydrolase [Agrococcus sp. BE272]|uniref:TatD family hydrolase n=1 Tax=Agrococcus sp. BE272 TaxID=2817727 RepID=UPI002855B9B7|nr:TatD family hydrolase [Agrococcus sp. BE272]MDR7233121.1 TatD DNase family protein [Agrococcus sp. BE272]
MPTSHDGTVPARTPSEPLAEAPRGTTLPGGEYIRERFDDGKRDLTRPEAPEPLGVPIYDNHTHLEIKDGDDFPYWRALDAAERAGVAGVIQVGGDVESSEWSAALAAQDRRVLAAVALHPNEAPGYAAAGTLPDALATIDALAAQPRVRAVGETGLDFFRTGDDGRRAQHESFEAHIDIAKRHGIALQIHDRDAHDAVVETLLRVGAPETTVFHCFSGDEVLARIAAEHGWYLSFAGTVTFSSAKNLHAALAVADRSRILVETDAPFLTPTPHRGRPNSPYLTPITVRSMAERLGMDADELAALTAENTVRAYGSWD